VDNTGYPVQLHGRIGECTGILLEFVGGVSFTLLTAVASMHSYMCTSLTACEGKER
jgi:hypothetical protein